MGKNLAVFWDSCFSLHSFLGRKCKNRLFLRKNDFEGIFDQFECKWLESGLADLEKHKILPFLLMVDFTHF